MKSIIVAFIIVVIILLLIIYATTNEYSYLNGFWVADAEFCEESELDIFWIYFDSINIFGKGNGYAVMMTNGKELINDNLNIDFSILPSILQRNALNGKIHIEWPENCDIPKDLDIEIDFTTMSMRFIEDEVLYARFYKDGQLSEIK